MSDLIEKLADVEHERWSRWMRYMFECGTFNSADGTWIMPTEKVERWQRQMNTSYLELSEREKESDRKEVWTSLKVLIEWISGVIPLADRLAAIEKRLDALEFGGELEK